MHASRTTISRGRSSQRLSILLVGLGVAIACLSGCGKSKAERDAEQAAEDARYDAATAAEWDRQDKLNHKVYASPVATAPPVPKISPAMAAALAMSNNRISAQPPDDTNQHSDFAQPATASDSELHEMYQEMMSNVRNNLPHSNTTRFYDADMNRAHTAVCGWVDYEMADGSHTRSKRQRFYATTSDAMVDTDAPGVQANFSEMISHIDCSAGMWRDSSQ